MKNYIFLLVLLNLFELILNTGNFYETLEVNSEATPEEIKKSYRALALKYHPDKNTDPKSTEIMKNINEANDILSDENKRKVYDFELKNKGKQMKTYTRRRKYSKGASSSKAETYTNTNYQNFEPISFNCNSSTFILNVFHDRIQVNKEGILYSFKKIKIINGEANKFEIHGNNLKLYDNIFIFNIEARSVKINIFGGDNKICRKNADIFKFNSDNLLENYRSIEAIINGHSNTFKINIEYNHKFAGLNLIEIKNGKNIIELYGRNIKFNNENLKIEDIKITKKFFNFAGAQNNVNFQGFQNFNFGMPQTKEWNFGETSNSSTPKTFNFFPEEPSNFGSTKNTNI